MQQLTELQEKWLKALESGEYRQGREKLKVGDSYCCLGVACLVAGKAFDATSQCDGADNYLPESVRAAIRLRNCNGVGVMPVNIGSLRASSLPNANDDGAAFSEIAAAIRANPENFFLPPEAP